MTDVGKDMKLLETSCMIYGNDGAPATENSMAISQKFQEIELQDDPKVFPLLCIYSK